MLPESSNVVLDVHGVLGLIAVPMKLQLKLLLDRL